MGNFKVTGVQTCVLPIFSVVPETVAVQPVGAALVENVTVPVNPLIAVEDSVEVLGVPITIVSEDGFAETLKSTTRNVTGDDCIVSVGLPPTPVTVAV